MSNSHVQTRVDAANRILFTGGGSAGHVTVNLALIPQFLSDGWEVEYIGSETGIERELIASSLPIPYYPIATGKLRRYLSKDNIKDPFRVIKGVTQAYRHIRARRPDVVFSKGGFVSVPVVIGAWLNRVPVVLHESDLTPGLANKIASRFAVGICTTFPETEAYIGGGKCHYVGPVLREEIGMGGAERGLAFSGFSDGGLSGDRKPVILVMGGSLGSMSINTAVRQALPELTQRFRVVHLCGRGHLDPAADNPDYRQFEYIDKELPDLLAMSDLIVSRAGSNSLFEFLSLKKPMLLIPLTKQQSRGDQLLNAASFERSGYAKVLQEERLDAAQLVRAVADLYSDKESYIRRMGDTPIGDARGRLQRLIVQAAGKEAEG
ncbi:undecaprenyldiphospho-muramoylpentapeptide beta-N-acetylglucosaminyltransferase [Cohnella fermenti]|uniref:UDP-N-acetylglucosamine--N-acetylmuramyl-(pentapeptide) pyrophosphoryl-undecaprenol N-acetylglucosamine transferase n=1 Tax=Cohnella fermenti TaxID=2565925 RepID=A0A4S4BN26_9BACL|nr:undecaprenyldiphospho-muramoylpentapeptide beta-N-acetylglucosaminyltransferase [Cohnella fermenti]THF76248.1 undecaprenyldiphospho-muramoylpentapeptide beta-N-acetylglucosaminyltransferase [Cohnella fermenti]